MQTMISKYLGSRAFGTVAVVLLCPLISACGTTATGDGKATASKVPKKSVQACLRRGGADVPQSTNELAFLAEAEGNNEVSKSGFVYDKFSRIVVRVWHAGTYEDRPPEWMVWFGQPFEEKRSPREIVEEKPAKSYVMYVSRPPMRLRRKVEACIRFSSDSAPAQEIHLHRVS